MDNTQLKVRALLEEGQEVHAIKLVRGALGCGLREAREYISALVEQWAPKQPVDAGVPDTGDLVATLQQGLLLERRKVFLPWGASLAQLQELGAPTRQGSGAILRWPGESVLGGLPVDSVSTGLLMSLRGLYHLNCRPADYAIYGDSQRGMNREFVHLSGVFGAPAEQLHGGLGYVWQLGQVRITLRVYSCNEFHYSEDYHKYVEIDWPAGAGTAETTI